MPIKRRRSFLLTLFQNFFFFFLENVLWVLKCERRTKNLFRLHLLSIFVHPFFTVSLIPTFHLSLSLSLSFCSAFSNAYLLYFYQINLMALGLRPHLRIFRYALFCESHCYFLSLCAMRFWLEIVDDFKGKISQIISIHAIDTESNCWWSDSIW